MKLPDFYYEYTKNLLRKKIIEYTCPMRNRIPKLNNLVDNLIERLNDDTSVKKKAVDNSISTYELLTRIDYIRMIVSLWKHACMADGVLALQEETSVNEMMSTLLNGKESLFPKDAINRDNLFDEMLEAFYNPAPIEDVTLFAKEDPQIAKLFFEEACWIVASDSQYMQKESEFLEFLIKALNLDVEWSTRMINEKVAYINN